MNREIVNYELALSLKELGFDEHCFSYYYNRELSFGARTSYGEVVEAPTFSQAINFLYICSNKQIDIELKASDTYEERVRKVAQGCEDLRNLQNNKSN